MTLLLLCSASLSHPGCVVMFRLGFASPFRRGGRSIEARGRNFGVRCLGIFRVSRVDEPAVSVDPDVNSVMVRLPRSAQSSALLQLRERRRSRDPTAAAKNAESSIAAQHKKALETWWRFDLRQDWRLWRANRASVDRDMSAVVT